MYYAENLRMKLSSVRTPHFSRYLVDFCTYLKEIVHDSATPQGLLSDVIRAKQDIMARNYSPVLSKDLKSSLIKNQNEILVSIALFPQVVDAITDSQFSYSFRYFFKEDFGFLPPKLLMHGKYYSDVVVDAVNWWTNAVFFPKNHFSYVRIPGFYEDFFAKNSTFTEKQYGTFQSLLAQLIEIRLLEEGKCVIGVHHDEHNVLSTAVLPLSCKDAGEILPERITMTIGKEFLISFEGVEEMAQLAG